MGIIDVTLDAASKQELVGSWAEERRGRRVRSLYDLRRVHALGIPARSPRIARSLTTG